MALTEQEQQMLYEAEYKEQQQQFKNYINECRTRQEKQLQQCEALKQSFQ